MVRVVQQVAAPDLLVGRRRRSMRRHRLRAVPSWGEDVSAEHDRTHSAATAWIICHTCGRRTLHIHDRGCQVCAPYVPPGTPNSREVTWWADLMDGKQTA